MKFDEFESRFRSFICFSVAVMCFPLQLGCAQEISSQPSAMLPASETQVVASLPVIPPGLNEKYRMEVQTSKSISAEYTYTVEAPSLRAAEWIMFAAKPPNLTGQEITNVKSFPASTDIKDLSPLQQPMIRARVPVRNSKLQQRIDFTIFIDTELYSRRLVLRTKSQFLDKDREKLSAKERMLALRPTGEFNYESRSLKTWLAKNELQRRDGEGEVDLARRIFLVIAKNFKYAYYGDQDRSASHVCEQGESDCGGMACLFVTACRAQGIPARTLAGRWAKSAKPEERIGQVVYFQEHVKAEFFAQGVGWVPADLSSAVLHDKSPQKLKYFGNDAGDFVTMHLDSELEFDSIHFGKKTMTLLQRPSYWATGSGNFDGVKISESWKVK